MEKVSLFLFLAMCVFLQHSAHGFIDNLPEKTVKPKTLKHEQRHVDLLFNTNITHSERCEFFKGFEDRFPCGKQYWIMNWGYKYCRRYADPKFVARFTAHGRKLLEHVNRCLPKHFEKMYKSKRPLRCKKLSQEAFEAQGKCYQEEQALFCTAFPQNKELFIEVLDHNDFANLDSISMIRKTAEKCEPKIDFLKMMSGQ
jgi:hypothetical protein